METKYIITNEKENSDFTVTYDCGHLIMMKEKLMFESIKGVQGRLTLEFKPTRYCPALNECLHKRYEGISIPSDFDGFDYFISNSGYVPSDTEFKTLTRLWKEYSISCQNYYCLCCHWRDFLSQLIDRGFKTGRHPKNNSLIVFCKKGNLKI